MKVHDSEAFQMRERSYQRKPLIRVPLNSRLGDKLEHLFGQYDMSVLEAII